MFKRLFTAIVLTVLVLSACSGQDAVATLTPSITETQVATALVSFTEMPAVTPTLATPSIEASTASSATLPTVTPTVGTIAPTNPADCTNKASFVADITIPDNTNIAGGTTFTKTWRIANAGTCVWGPTYTLVYYSGERMGAPVAVPLGVTYPGQNLDISIDLKAPNSTGTYQGNFVIKNPKGLIMSIGVDSRLWAIINVTVTTSITATATATALSNAAVGSPTITSTGGSATAVVTTVATSGVIITTGSCLFSINLTKLTALIEALNTYRAQKGLPAYTVNAQLAQAAQRQANDAACHKLYVHTGTDGSTPKTRVADTGYIAKSVSENINGNYPPLDAQGALNWWINDKTDLRHSQNLVSTTFKEIGVGYSFFDNYGFYVIVFAQP